MTTERQEQAGNETSSELEERITQAIQPVAASFREQLAQVVTQQIEQSGLLEEPDLVTETKPEQGPESEAQQTGESKQQIERAAASPQSEEDAERAQQPSAERQDSPRDQPDAPQTSAPEDDKPEDHEESVSGVLSDVLKSSTGNLGRTFVEHGSEWLQSGLNGILDALFSEEIQATVRQQAEEGLETLVAETFNEFPDSDKKVEAQEKTETELEALLQETLDQIFSESLRNDLQRYGDEAMVAVLSGDFETARTDGARAVETLFDHTVSALQGHWGRVLRLLLDVSITLIQGILADKVSDALKAMTPGNEGDVQEKADTVKEQVQEKGEVLRDRMQDAAGTMRDRIQEGAQELQDRLTEGLKAGTRNTQLGHAPSGPPPSRRGVPGRAPRGRPPSGKPPSGRPPSAR